MKGLSSRSSSRAKTIPEIEVELSSLTLSKGYEALGSAIQHLNGRIDRQDQRLTRLVDEAVPFLRLLVKRKLGAQSEGLRERKSLDDVAQEDLLAIDAELQRRYGDEYEPSTVPDEELEVLIDHNPSNHRPRRVHSFKSHKRSKPKEVE